MNCPKRRSVRSPHLLRSTWLFASSLIWAGACTAGPHDGRLLGTAGTLQVEGVGGGGLVPWATIAGYGSEDQYGIALGSSHFEQSTTRLSTVAVALGLHNRVEFSLAKQTLQLDQPNISIKQDVFGFKWRVAGDLIYGDQPQWTLGLQAKRLHDDELASALGNQRQGIEPYLSVARLWLNGPFGRHVFLNGTLRASRAQQTGLLGFGDRWAVLPELSAAVFLDRRWAVGLEYRFKPDALDTGHEDDWKDLFLSFSPNKHCTLVLAGANLGRISGERRVRGTFLSLQVTP